VVSLPKEVLSSASSGDPITALELNKSHPITQPVCVRLFLSPHSILINNVFNGLKGRTYGTRRRELLEFNKEKVSGLIIIFKNEASEVLLQFSGPEGGSAFDGNSRDLFRVG